MIATITIIALHTWGAVPGIIQPSQIVKSQLLRGNLGQVSYEDLSAAMAHSTAIYSIAFGIFVYPVIPTVIAFVSSLTLLCFV